MSQLNHKGPDGEGPKTGRKLGLCHKTEIEKEQTGELGKGQGKCRKSGGGKGKGKRLQYDKNNNLLK